MAGKKTNSKVTGKSKAKIARYYAQNAERKLKRLLKNNGEPAARAWAIAHMEDGILNRLLRESAS